MRVRRAVAHAIDRQFLLKNVWYGFGKPSTGPVSSAMTKFYAPVITSYKFDPALAQSLLDEAGHKRGAGGIRFRITHDPLPGSDFYTGTAEYFRAAMARIGIAVEIRDADFPTFYRRVYTDNDFDSTNFLAFNLTDPTLARFDLGYSFCNGATVLDLILGRLPATLLLMVAAIGLAVTLGAALGLVAARRPGSVGDHLISVALLSYATPLFWLGLMGIVLFPVKLRWLPTGGLMDVGTTMSIADRVVDVALHTIMPAVTLGLFYMAVYTRLVRPW